MNTPTEKEHEEILKQLKKSPVFNMSLASKELFHSNFWAWLFELDKTGTAYIDVFFPEFSQLHSGDEYVVLREYQNMDLRIHVFDSLDPKKITHRYVIENKVKSIPSAAQLEGYTTKLESEASKFVPQSARCLLTSIVEPHWQMPRSPGSSTTVWLHQTLADIAEKIKDVAEEKEEGKSYVQYIISDYAQSLRLLTELILDENLESNVYDFHLANAQTKMLQEVRMLDIYRKLRQSQMLSCISPNLVEQFAGDDGSKRFEIEESFSNGKTLCTFRFTQKIEQHTVVIGIQIQGNQYRKFIQTSALGDSIKNGKVNGTYSVDNLKVVQECIQKGWFSKEKPDGMLNLWCAYKPYFLYQHSPISIKEKGSKNMVHKSYSEVLEMLEEDLTKASLMFSESKLVSELS